MSQLKADTFGRLLEAKVNASPLEGGQHRKASWCAHEQTMYLEEHDADRIAILKDNRRLYLENKGKARKDLAGGVPLRIPQSDYAEIYRKNPHLHHCDMKTRSEFFTKLYRDHPEYRIG